MGFAITRKVVSLTHHYFIIIVTSIGVGVYECAIIVDLNDLRLS